MRNALCCCCLLLLFAASAQGATEVRVVAGKDTTLVCDPAMAARKRMGPDYDGPDLVRRVEWRQNGAIVANYQQGFAMDTPRQWWVSSARMQWVRGLYSLIIGGTEVTDTASYECRVEVDSAFDAPYAEKPGVVRLIVVGKPDPPGRAVVTSFTARSVTLSWPQSATPPHVPIQRYMVMVSYGNRPDASNHKLVYANGNETTLVVSSLRPYTEYTFQAIAENEAGRSEPGQSVTARTKGEAPVAAPTIKQIRNGTDGALLVEWEPPPSTTLHGPLVGHRLMAHELRTGAMKEWYVQGANTRAYVLHDLNVYTKYMLSVEADNNFGYSPMASMIVTTDEGVPSNGPDVTSVQVKSSESIYLSWVPPKEPNGVIVSYIIYYLPSGREEQPMTSQVDANTSTGAQRSFIDYTITHLEPYTKYSVWVTASTRKGESEKSEINHVYTDTKAPSAPEIANITMSSGPMVTISWRQPAIIHRRVDVYSLTVTAPSINQGVTRMINTTDQFATMRLEVNIRYVASVIAVTRSIVDRAISFVGPRSKEEAFLLSADKADSSVKEQVIVLHTTACSLDSVPKSGTVVCDKSLLSAPGSHGIGETSPFVKAVISACAVFLAIGACAFAGVSVKRKYYGQKRFPDEPTYVSAVSDPYDDSDAPSLPVSAFASHVQRLHEDGDAGFAAEFQMISDGTEECFTTCEHSKRPENKSKNRYANITAYDHSRVILRNTSGNSESTDYINANFVDGYHKKRAYIATQGPLPNTFVDFWRMVWEQRTMVIVMITNLLENGRKKCDQYWPSEGTEVYGGQFQVRLISEQHTAYYVTHMLSLKNLRCLPRPSERIISHFHFTHWPDHGVPSSSLDVLSFVRKSSEANADHAGPMVVHCSAGVGRSGTYIVIDSMIRQVRDRKTINIFAFLRRIRQQRNYLVQTEEQYIFCHEALLEMIRTGCTEVTAANFDLYIDRILPEVDLLSGKSLLQMQYNMVTLTTELSTSDAQLTANRTKNRLTDSCLPVNLFRVVLSSRTGIDNSDYINASFFQGYHKLDEFIVTQWPFHETVPDFWRMVWEHNCQTIVLLCDADDSSFKPFWPFIGSDRLVMEKFSVNATDCATTSEWTLLDVMLQSDEDEFQLPVRIVQCASWSSSGSPVVDADSAWDLVRSVQQWHVQYQDGPVVVVDRFGWTQAATFCALTTAACQLDQDGAVDIYRSARLYQERRPGIWSTCEDYYFLYECVRQLLREDISSITSDGITSRPSFRTARKQLSSIFDQDELKPIIISDSEPKRQVHVNKLVYSKSQDVAL